MRRILPWLLSLVAAPQIAASAEYVPITILHTNDLHGMVMADHNGSSHPSTEADAPDGMAVDRGYGLAKIATLVREITAEMPNVLLIDGGDIIHGSYEDYLSRGQATITAMNAAGYSAAAAGNHEFDFGLDVTRNALRTAVFPFLAANIRDKATGRQWDKVMPYAIISMRDIRIAVMGLATHETVSLQWPRSIEEIAVDDPVTTARNLVPHLRKQADVVVVLSHLGHPRDLMLPVVAPGIDFIVGGHSHTAVMKWRWVRNTLVTQAGSGGEYLGRIDFIVKKNEKGSQIISVNGKHGRTWNDLKNPPLGKVYPTGPLLSVSDALADDAAVLEAFRPFREQANAVLDEQIAEALEEISTVPGPSGEIAAGNLAADAVRSLGGSDIGLIDVRSVASGLPPGPVSVRDAFNMISGFTRQQIVVVRMTGRELRNALASNLMAGGSLRLQISGATVVYRGKRTSGSAVTDVLVGEVPIDAARHYTIAAQAYVIQRLNRSVPKMQVLAEPDATTREAITGYLRSLGTVTSPGTGRIARGS